MPSRRRLFRPVKTIGFKIAAGYSALFLLSFIAMAVAAYLLVAVRAVVRAHHGHVHVSSTPGTGSLFEIHLPGAHRFPPA